MISENIKYCECGCGTPIKPANRFVSGHNRRGTKNTPEHNLAISQYNKLHNPATNKETAVKISKALTGKKQSLETRLKRSKSLTNNPKVIASRIGNQNRKGTTTSSKARKNMSNSAKNKAFSDSHKEAISNGLIKYFSVIENRIKRVKEISNRIQLKGYQYKNGYLKMSNFNRKLFYRSSYEKLALIILDTKYNEIKDIFTECIHIPYKNADGSTRVYTPDIFVKMNKGKDILIEVKPNCFVNNSDVVRKTEAGIFWAKQNNVTFCIWTEDILHNSSSTTTCLQEIVNATVVYPRGRRYSLNSMETLRREQK